MPLLETKNLGISFGGLQAVQGVHLTLNEGEIVGLIGPNGAGKTTVFNLLTDVYLPTEGGIELELSLIHIYAVDNDFTFAAIYTIIEKHRRQRCARTGGRIQMVIIEMENGKKIKLELDAQLSLIHI